MHAAVWFDEGLRERDRYALNIIRQHWLAVAEAFGAGPRGQHVALIDDSIGWFQYFLKHAVCGLKYYQRFSDNMPLGWEITGRMWGYVGDWPVQEPTDF